MKLFILDQGGSDRPTCGRILIFIIEHTIFPLKRELLAVDAIDSRFSKSILSKRSIELRLSTLDLPDVILLQVLPLASLSGVQPSINT